MFQETSSESKSGQKSANGAIRLIDLQIANLHESIRILKSQRNSHLPISTLPVEILTKIFLLHQHNVTVQTLDWIGITHVSRRWREIALNFSGLWTCIPFHHPKWAKEMIVRSQHACPIVKANYIPSIYPSEARLLKNFLQQHLSRVQVLEIFDTNLLHVAKLFQDIQPTSVPCLSTLSLSVQWQKPGTEPSAVLNLLQMVDSRLLNTNSLRKLNVSTTPRWDLRLFSGLIHLKLGDGHNMPRTQTSQRKFLDALRRMPNLQSLYLDGPALPEAVDKSLLEPVHLPDLRDLDVFDTVPTIEFFLHHVTFPPTTRTAIGCRHPDPVLQLADISPILILLKRLLSERPRALKLHHIEFMCFEETDDWDLKFEGWVSAGCSSLEGYDPNSAADFTFFVEWDSDQANTLSPIDELSVGMFGIFPPDDVVSLLLSSYDDTCFRHFAREIGQLSALNTLYLSYISSAPFLQELDCDAPTYPALRCLDFSDHQIRIDVFGLTTLYSCLKKRSELGLGPEKLKMDLCVLRNLDKHTTTLLEKVVEVEPVRNDCDSLTLDSSVGHAYRQWEPCHCHIQA
jgi:hypothetical protein